VGNIEMERWIFECGDKTELQERQLRSAVLVKGLLTFYTYAAGFEFKMDENPR
jgi:hypothetical protein